MRIVFPSDRYLKNGDTPLLCHPYIVKQWRVRWNYNRGRYSLVLQKNSMSALKTAETIFLSDIPKKFEYASVSINSNMEDLIARAMAQNFVPVVDDQNKFIGIVTRKDIIGYCYKKLKTMQSD